MKPLFSIALIARNEAKTLPRLLASLEDFRNRGGEIVLVDTGSTDATAQIARDAGCRVEEVGDRFRHTITKEEYDGINETIDLAEGYIVQEGDTLFDYSSARNYAASLASNDFVAMPDCDEVYTQFEIDALNAAIEDGASQLEYQFVYAHDAQTGAPVIQFSHSKFYDRRKMHWVGIIHEVLQGDGAYTGATKIPETVIKLEHFQNEETNRSHYLTGLALDVYLHPENDRNSHYFGRELMYRGHFNSAIRELKRHVEMNRWPAERAQSMIYIGDCYMMQANPLEALAWYFRAFDVSPNRREPLMKLAEYYYQNKSAAHVIPLVAAALQVTQPDDFYGNHQPYYEHIPHEMMYWALWQKGELAEARAHFDACLGYQPWSEKYLEDMRWFYPLPQVSVLIHGDDPDAIELTRKSFEQSAYPQELISFEQQKEGMTLEIPAGMVLDRMALNIAWKVAADNRKNLIALNIDGNPNSREVILVDNRVRGDRSKQRSMFCYQAHVQEYVASNENAYA